MPWVRPDRHPKRWQPKPPAHVRPVQPERRRPSLARRAWRRLRRPLALLLAVVVVLGALQLFVPWPVTTTLRHLAAAPHCELARLVELAPARTGEPGYHPWLDADADGIACEVPQS
jgi:hypothetical protein